VKAAAEFTELRLTEAQRCAFLERVRAAVGPEDYRLIEGMTHGLPRLIELIEQTPTMPKLRRLVFGPKTEKTRQVFPPTSPSTSASSDSSTATSSTTTAGSKPKAKGHGRTKARDYTGAIWVSVPHPQLQAGAACPCCGKGTVRKQKSPAIILRIVGAPPISATGYEMERWRCDTCGEVFTAPTPPEAGTEKFAPSAGVTVALLRYGSGMPHYRLAKLQKTMGVPMPASTQWEVMLPLAQQAQPILEELITQAAQSPLVHHDDTTMRILDLRRPGSATAAQMNPERKGTFTTNILAYVQDHPVALYFTGWKHAGENLANVLLRREASLPPPIQMCDALSRNFSPEFDSILALCLGHGRREFVSVAEDFPAECRYVLESLGEIYRVDAEAKEQAMTPEQRLAHHQTHSQPVMERLQAWMRQQIDGKLIEPNSGLGEAIGYMDRHWKGLTLFLRQAGAPLDNNICERALKMAILHRKNSLSYKTVNGARTGDLFMSLIHTCQLNGTNPFDYLMAIATHAAAVKLIPKAWLPWNYPKPSTTTDSS
jgi:transposase